MLSLATRPIWVSFLALMVGGCNHVDEVTPRSYVGLLLGQTGHLKAEIAKALIEKRGLSSRQVSEAPQDIPVDYVFVTTSGVLISHSRRYGVVVVQEPLLQDGAVIWKCFVYPSEAAPGVCKN
jgi:hypothetical protein